MRNEANPLRVFSFGGGVQSVAVLVLQAQQRLPEPYHIFAFANVGDDSEHPKTLRYYGEIALPYARANGIELEMMHKTTHGKAETLYEYIHRTEKSVPIPARMSNGAPGNRSCTQDFKIRLIDKLPRQIGASHAVIGLGITIDEIRRMRDEKWHDKQGKRRIGYWKRREHPLIDLRLNRSQCEQIILEAGLPIPPKSACWFCPYTHRSVWRHRKQNEPQLFAKAVRLEKTINEKRNAIERDMVFLHPAKNGQMKPLDEAVDNQLPLFDEEDTCDGYCFT